MRIILLLLTLSTTQVWAQSENAPEAAFTKIPFDEWVAAGSAHSPFMKWNARVSKPELSFHQRLLAQVEVNIDGRELSKRRGEGQLLIFVQITDEQDRRYRAHGSIDLSKLDENIRKADISYTHSMFVMPGEYRLDVAILDTTANEHGVKQTRFRVGSLRDDPLPASWSGLPKIEFTSSSEPPEAWFLPEIKGRLDLGETKKPLRLDIVTNISPTERPYGSRNPPNANLNALLPTLKTLADAGADGIQVNLEMVDLARQKVVLEAKGIKDLEWSRVKAALEDGSSGKIDIKSLEDRHRRASFITGELTRVLQRDSATPRVLVVLTNAVTFEGGAEQIREPLPPNTRVVYIRLRAKPPVRRVMTPDPRFGGRRMPPPRFPAARGGEGEFDQLEPLLKPLRPDVFDVETPEQARKAIARVLGVE